MIELGSKVKGSKTKSNKPSNANVLSSICGLRDRDKDTEEDVDKGARCQTFFQLLAKAYERL